MNRQSDLNRTKRAESLRKTTAEQAKIGVSLGMGLGSPRGQFGLKQLVEEIIKYLMQIIEALLQEENSANYRNFMAASQAMNSQLERKIQNNLAEKLFELRCQFIDRLQEVEKKAKHVQRPSQENNLRQQRKLLTQNILQRSGSFNCLQNNRSHQRIASTQELPHVMEGEEVGSIELQSIQSKMSALEQTGRLRQAVEKLERKFEENCKDIKQLTQKHVEFRMSFQEKLELSLESLWNVISDNQAKLCEIQRVLNVS